MRAAQHLATRVPAALQSLHRSHASGIAQRFLTAPAPKAPIKDIIYIAGPGNKTFNHKDVTAHVNTLRQAGANVLQVGDGEIALSPAYLDYALSDEFQGSSSALIFVLTHGKNKDGKLSLNIDNEDNILAGQLFNTVSRAFKDTPVDMLMGCCHGGLAIPEIDKLPANSTVVTLSPGPDMTYFTDINRFMGKLQAPSVEVESFSAMHLLDRYLTSLKSKVAPVIAMSGGDVYAPADLLHQRNGQAFSDKEKALVHAKLDPLTHNPDTTTQIIKAIEQQYISPDQFGFALLAMHALHPEPNKTLRTFDIEKPSMPGWACRSSSACEPWLR